VCVLYYTWLWQFGTGVHYYSFSSSTYGHHYVFLARVLWKRGKRYTNSSGRVAEAVRRARGYDDMWQGQQYQQRTGQRDYCQCQMPTASTAVLEARQPRFRAKWEGGYGCGTMLATIQSHNNRDHACLMHPCAGSTL